MVHLLTSEVPSSNFRLQNLPSLGKPLSGQVSPTNHKPIITGYFSKIKDNKILTFEVSQKNESVQDDSEGPLWDIVPSLAIPCSRQYNSQTELPAR